MRAREHTGRALDQYVAASARLGNAKAFELLVRRWNGKLAAHAWRLLGDTDLAREAVQEAWVEIVRGLPTLADPAAFPAWAYRIVSRRCFRLIGGIRRDRQLGEALALEPVETGSDGAGEQDARLRLRAAIAALPPEQGAAIALFYLEELSVAEVAVALDVPAGTVKTRLMHARRKLRSALEGEV